MNQHTISENKNWVNTLVYHLAKGPVRVNIEQLLGSTQTINLIGAQKYLFGHTNLPNMCDGEFVRTSQEHNGFVTLSIIGYDLEDTLP